MEYRDQKVELPTALAGKINAYILAACGTALSYGFDWETIARGIADCRQVPGRFERVGLKASRFWWLWITRIRTTLCGSIIAVRRGVPSASLHCSAVAATATGPSAP